jgi:hypothetical protein
MFLNGGAAVFAEARLEKLIFVDPPLRLITQCELRKIGERELTCNQDGWPRKVALNQGVTVWKGKDRNASALRAGDRLDIKLGLDEQGHEVATFIWANFVKVEGVLGVPGTVPWIRVHPLVPYSVGEVATEPLYVRVESDATFVGGTRFEDLRQGRPVIVIGERVDDRRIRASRIVLSRE